jgi:membrane dipeptidase
MESRAYLDEARAIHERTLVCAVHTDVIGAVAEGHHEGEQGVLSRAHAGLFRAGGIGCISDHVIGDTFETQSFPTRELLNAYYGGRLYNPSLLKHAVRNLTFMLRDIAESAADFGLATTVAGIEELAAQGRIAVVLCTQGLTFLEDEPLVLEVVYRLGVRVLGVVTYRANAVVGSYQVNPDQGLTPFGRTVVAEAKRLRMVFDISSVSQQGFWDLIEAAEGPVIASHTNVAALCSKPGNLDDRQLAAIRETNGLVGLIANGELITDTGPATLSAFVDHIDYIADRIGVEHVALGPDIVEEAFYPLETYRRVFGDEAWTTHYPRELESHRDLPNVTAELLRRGYKADAIVKILGENALRVYRQVWGE